MNIQDNALELIRRRAEGIATEADRLELEGLLREDPSLQDFFIDYILMDAELMRLGEENAGTREAQEESKSGTISKTSSRLKRLQPWILAMAASLVFMAVIGSIILLPTAHASSSTLLQRALKVHAAAMDRCYRVEVRGVSAPVRINEHESRLWTRGDRFWNELHVGKKSVAWGRDADGGVWFSLTPEAGARLAADEVPEAFELACDLRGLEMTTLLRTILADFDLRREPMSEGAYLVHAELKPGREPGKYSSVLLEVDAESSVLRRVVLHRTYKGRPVAILTFTLIESNLNDDSSYTLAGHLSTDAVIYDRLSGRDERGALIAEFLRLVRSGDETRTGPKP